MSDVVIRVEELSKKYIIGTKARSSGEGLRHALHDGVSAPFRKIESRIRRRGSKAEGPNIVSPTAEVFWALRNVSFEVNRGEVLGIIGRNGAGKSTLLKILSRITEPTSGRIGLKGRIASLLEVGTGFHPELTGRDNIFLNGAILGMTRAEVKSSFDEIVAFAEVGKFLDTPVKRYSSGMYVRLAFAVAAHLEPEILIVDEVLAVGDDQFQKKCLGKMEDISGSGRTVLFVSHNMGSVVRLCHKALHLSHGELVAIGSPRETVDAYVNVARTVQGYVRPEGAVDATGIYITSIRACSGQDGAEEFRCEEDITVVCRFVVNRPVRDLKIGITVQDQFQHYIATTIEYAKNIKSVESEFEARLIVPGGFLAPNFYSFRVALFESIVNVYDLIEVTCPIKISDNGSPMATYEGINYGDVILPFRWVRGSGEMQ